MKLWMIMTLFGNIGAVAGPLPYDMEECLFRVSIRQATVESMWDPDNAIFKGRIVTPDDIEYKCVLQNERPQLGPVLK